MQNEIMLKQNNAPAREISVVTAEIKELCRQATNIVLAYAIEIGRRLVEAKGVLPHGSWGDWLKNEVEFSQSTANNYMRLFEEYGDQQIGIFGAVSNSQTIANLPYSKALQLLLLPADEREAFAAEVKAEELSVKELKNAIDGKLAAEKQAAEEKRRADELAEKVRTAEAAQKAAEVKAAEAEALEKTVLDMEDKLKAVEAELAEKAKALQGAEGASDVSSETLKQIRSEAETAAKEKTEKALHRQMKELEAARDKALAECASVQRECEAAQKLAADAQTELEQARKQLKTASPEVAAFKSLFEEIQKIGITLKDKVEKIRKDDPETADKLSKALKAFGGTL